MDPRLTRQLGAFGAVVLCALLMGAGCNPLKGVGIDTPLASTIFTGDPIAAEGRLGRNLDLATATVEVNGVDLIAALALAPPFSDAGGVVNVGPDTVTVSNFDLEEPAQGPRIFTVTLTGLSIASHNLTVTAYDPAPAVTKLATTDFALVVSMAEEASATISAGLPLGPLVSASEGSLVNVSVGQALAAPPVAITGGDTVRSGIVEVSAELGD